MAVTPDQVTVPVGYLDRELMFPKDTPEYFSDVRVTGYITQGQQEAAAIAALPTFDKAVKAYAHYRGFDAWATRLSGSAAKVDIKADLATEYLLDQMKDPRERATEFYNEFLGYLTNINIPVNQASPNVTGFTANVFTT